MNFQNGRVVNIQSNPNKKYDLFNNNNNNKDTFKNIALKGIQENTKLNQLFFARHNMDFIQNKIRYSIYTKSNKKHIISKQSYIELEIIMRSIYLQYSKNLNYDYDEQINNLNKLVINECIQKILPEINQYYTYINDVSHLPIPLELPKNLSSAGTKNNRSITSTF